MKSLHANWEAAKFFWLCYWYAGLPMAEALDFSEQYYKELMGPTKPKGKLALKLEAHLDRLGRKVDE